MKARVFISRDSGALCVGADEVARALFKAAEKRGLDIEIVRTGSRGMYWLEPTIEVERPEGRIGYGPTKPSDIDSLLDAGMHYAEISKRTGASTATITRIASWLHHGEGGYKAMLDRLKGGDGSTPYPLGVER